MAGFFKVDHDEMAHPVFGGSGRRLNRWEAYCWLLDHAAIGSQELTVLGKPIQLDRGQLALSIGALATAWKWPKSSVQRFLDGLSREGFVVYSPVVVPNTSMRTGTRTGASLITLCNYAQTSVLSADGETGMRTGTRTGDPMTPYRDTYVKKREEKRRSFEEGTSPASPTTPAERRQGELLPQAEVVAFTPPVEQIAFDAYNALAVKIDLRECRSFSPARRSAMRARLRELGGIDGWTMALDKVSESPFIRDWRTNGWTGFGLHSLLQPNTLAKLMDGAYSGKRQTRDTPHTAAMNQAIDYAREHNQESFYRGVSKTGTVKI